MFLKRIELQGFKTFVGRTVFDFEPGVTAVVGPNGSGKSNLADAVRWALGEQSVRLLRIRRAEDVIFAGNAARAPVGLAEVALLFDNADGRLPIESAEVSISRRLLRSGESDYLINRRRVRWRDLTDTLLRATIGSAGYTVIGQGMVDQAIVQRPEERRLLFEEAADVRRLYAKLDEAKEHLARTQENLVRVGDLVAQIEPDLSRLEQQAGRADEHDRLTRLLAELLETWYRALWQRAASEIEWAESATAARRRVLAEARAEATLAEDRVATLAADLGHLHADLAGRRESLASAQRQLARLEAASAAAADRRRLLAIRRSELDGEQATLAEDLDRCRQQADAADREATQVAVQEEAAAAAVLDIESQTQQLGRVAAEAERRHREVEGERLRRETEAKLVRAEQGRLEARRQSLAAETEAILAQRATSEGRALAHGDSAAEVGRRLEEGQQLAANAADVAERTRRRLDDSRATLGAAEEAKSAADRACRALGDRVADVERRATQGGSLYPGVRSVLTFSGDGAGDGNGARMGKTREAPTGARSDSGRALRVETHTGSGRGAVAAATPRLRGIVGLVSQVVQVPADLEVAIEAALGGRLQDVVVERWEDAEAAVDLLKQERAGRATFLPLDTIRAGPAVEIATRDGIVGVAARLVGYEPRFRSIVALLLGGTVVVRDLAAAHRLLREARDGEAGRRPQQIVTLGGEIVRLSGSVTGGATPRATPGGLLALERERRDLSEQLAIAQQAAAAAATKIGGLRLEEQAAAAAATAAELAERQARRALRGLEDEAGRIERAATAARQDVDGLTKTLGRLAHEEVELSAARHQLEARLNGLTPDPERSGAAAETRSTLDRFVEQREQVRRQLGEANTGLAGLAAERRRLLAETRSQVAAAHRIEERLAAARRRCQEVEREAAAAESEARALTAEQTITTTDTSRLEREAQALAERVTAHERERVAVLARLAGHRAALARAEADLSAAEVDLERARLARDSLVERMAADGFAPPDLEEMSDHQLSLLSAPSPTAVGEGAGGEAPASGQWAVGSGQDPASRERARSGGGGEALTPNPQPPTPVAVDPDSVRRRIERVRGQIRALGPVNSMATAEYAAARERHQFLAQQSADLRATERELREGLSDLQATIARRFQETFERVNAEFRRTFAALFGGGAAHLTLTDPADVATTGIEIEAQPPGKRLQPLPLLSGGEKALTAVALLFALLTVNPTPICLLDEVDAALDEANVGRFADLLRRLAGATQFIIITHNRATMERADALYGISLGPGGQSVPVSLRLEDPRGI